MCCRPMTAGACGLTTASRRPPVCSAAPARRSSDEIVVVGYSSGEVFGLRPENGRVIWSDSLATTRSVNAVAGLADIRGRPVVDRGRAYAISHSGRMAAIDLRTGERAWDQPIGSSHGPWVCGDYIFVLAADNQAGLPASGRREGSLAAAAAAFSGRKGEVRSDLLGRTGARRQPADRAVLDRRNDVAVAADRRHRRPAGYFRGGLSRSGNRARLALLVDRRRKSLRLSRLTVGGSVLKVGKAGGVAIGAHAVADPHLTAAAEAVIFFGRNPIVLIA